MEQRRQRILFLVATTAIASCGAGEREIPNSQCVNGSDLSQVPAAYSGAMMKYLRAGVNTGVVVCTEDSDNDGQADFIVVESQNTPDHESVYFEDDELLYEDYDYDTNIYKYESLYGEQAAHSAGPNKILAQRIVMKMPITPSKAASPTATDFGTIGLALNGVSFFNENAAPGDEILDELFTFDQCSGHPQQQNVYHYHADPVCLIRDLGGRVDSQTITVGDTTYEWLTDSGNNANLLLGFVMDGFGVYGPLGNQESDCQGNLIDPATIDAFNGHSHCTNDFSEPTYHYHVKSAASGGAGERVFWITNEFFYGEPGAVF